MKVSELGCSVVVSSAIFLCALGGCSRYLSNAKAAEARNSINAIGRSASAAFESERVPDAVLKAGESMPAAGHALCKSAANSVPASAESIRGIKYMSNPAEWLAGSENDGWRCLKFSIDNPQYYMYSYKISGSGSHDGDTFTATANGDLNGDRKLSTFTGVGKVSAQSVVVSSVLAETDPTE